MCSHTGVQCVGLEEYVEACTSHQSASSGKKASLCSVKRSCAGAWSIVRARAVAGRVVWRVQGMRELAMGGLVRRLPFSRTMPPSTAAIPPPRAIAAPPLASPSRSSEPTRPACATCRGRHPHASPPPPPRARSGLKP